MDSLRYLGSLGTTWNLRLVTPCRSVEDGMAVLVNLGNRRVVEGTVSCAAGYHCRVDCADGIARWVSVDDVARPKRPKTIR